MTSVGTHQDDDIESFPAGTTTTVFPGLYGGVETPMAFIDGDQLTGAIGHGESALRTGRGVVAPLTFDATTLTVSAGAQVALSYANDSALPHNWHMFDGSDASAASIAPPAISCFQDILV